MTKYQSYQSTTVPVVKTQSQIEKMLVEHGAVKTHFMKDYEKDMVILAWERKIILDGSPKIQPLMHHISFRDRKEAQVYRALFYHLKAKFEAVDFQIVSFEEEFLPYFLVKLPDGKPGTIAEYFVPDLHHGMLPQMKQLDNRQLASGKADYEILEG